MNKTAIKNFAIWARNKLIADIRYKAGLLGITEKGFKSPLPQSTQTVQFFDIGTKEPSSITGIEIQQRKKLVEEIERKAKQSDYTTAYKNVIEEVAYTWFNRLIAIRFMEVNDYLPTRIRVLSSESNGKAEPDLVTHALEANFNYSAYEKDRIIQLKNENKLDELFRMLFIKQCNALNANLPELFEKTSDYTELLLNVSFTDKEGIIYHLINDIDEDDFNISKEGQVEIIGWLYQYYNTEPKDETFALLKKNVKITKERIPAATQLFTPDWIVRYMVENSLGRLWLEGHPNDELKSNWEYYLDEAEQEEEVQKQLDKIREDSKNKKPEDIKVIDPAMGSGHILVYAFDVLMQIYESYGYSQRDAAKSIIENNLYGLDIDNRAYQLAYFALMMKARQYNRRFLNGNITCNIYSIQESNGINRSQLKYFGASLSDMGKNAAFLEICGLLDAFIDAKEYGSIIELDNYNWELLHKFIDESSFDGQMSIDSIGIENIKGHVHSLIKIGEVMSNRYDVVVTNPPYMGSGSMSNKLLDFLIKNYSESRHDLFAAFIEKCNDLVKPSGYQAMITMHSWMYLSRIESFRMRILKDLIVNMVHLGARAFEEIGGEVVQTVAFVITKSQIENYDASYLRLVNYPSQSLKEEAFFTKKDLFVTNKEMFELIPGHPVAYWVNKTLISHFASKETMGTTRKGMVTADNPRFIRTWEEVDISKIAFNCTSREEAQSTLCKWFPYKKGGEFRKWYGNSDWVVNWENDGFELMHMKAEGYSVGSTNQNLDYIFKSANCWTKISSSSLSCRYTPNGYLYDDASPFVYNPDFEKQLYILALLNTKVAQAYLDLLNPTLNYSPGTIANVPVVIPQQGISFVLEIVKRNLQISQADWNSFETSWEFKRHPLLCSKNTIAAAFANWEREVAERFDTLKANEEELNRIFIDIYNLQDELTPEVDDKDVTVRRADLGREIRSFISFAVGCMFGRYSLDVEGLAYAGGDWVSSNYKSFIPDKDNILPISDEEYFDDDIVGRFVEFVKIVFGANMLEENLNFVASAMGGKGMPREVIRNYFMNEFYKDHCKIYQKRPIYWLFDSGKQNGFKALIYMHRYNENTIGNLRIDYLHRMQRIYENEIARMQDTIENSRDAREVTAANKRKEKLIKQLQETKEYDEKIAHLALARTSIDLDDGVKVNYEKIQTDQDGKKLDVLAKI